MIVRNPKDIAKEIVFDLETGCGPHAKAELIEEIAKALQDAFDLGFKAAGGSIYSIGEIKL